MVDYRRIVRQWRHGSAQVLVTLVRVEGSSYRRPGAHLLVGTDGEYAGTISGGCLEAEVVRMAAWIAQAYRGSELIRVHGDERACNSRGSSCLRARCIAAAATVAGIHIVCADGTGAG